MTSPHTPRYDASAIPLLAGRVAAFPVSDAAGLLAAEDPVEATRAFLARCAPARNAVALASPALGAAIDEWLAGKPLRNSRAPLRALSYAVRMASRCTPFGLFAGIGILEDDGGGTVRLDETSTRYRSHTRADMELVGAIVAEVERGELRERVRFTTNDCAFVRGDRLIVTNVALGNVSAMGARDVVEQREVSLRNTKAVVFVRGFCERPVEYRDVVNALCAQFGADAGDSRRLLDRLIEAGVVISELRPSPIGDPIRGVLARLEAIGAPQGIALRAAIDGAQRLDATPVLDRSPLHYADVARAFAQTVPAPPENAVQLDLQVALPGTLPAGVLDDVATLAGLAMRSGRVLRMDRYRERFVQRYEGVDRMVPLLELVDGDLGLGTPEEATLDAGDDTARQQSLVQLFCDAARDGTVEIDLREGGLLDTVFPVRDEGRAPRALELGFAIAAESADALERGEYRLLSTLLMDRPMKSLARFVGLLGSEAVAVARAIAGLSKGRGELTAELAYAPVSSRAYNVCIRPRVHDIEVRAGIGAPTFATTISPDDLWVGLDDDRFYLWSRSHGRRVTVCETHALTTAMSAPNLCRFLALAYCDGVRLPEFHLGRAEELTYIPRLTYGRLVLRPRAWRLTRASLGTDASAIAQTLPALRERWSMPRYVYLCQGDNQLLLDLDGPAAAMLLGEHARDAMVDIEEALPAPNETWLRGSRGTHAAEFVAQAVAVDAPAVSPERKPAPQLLATRPTFGPGSRWSYLKLYVGRQSIDDLIVSHVAPLAGALRERGATDRWFFIRYADPEHHVRLRVRASEGDGRTSDARERLLEAAQGWVAAGIVRRYALDTYDPEYERYGTGERLDRIERFFDYDSELCALVLADRPADSAARIEAATASFHDLLRSERATRLVIDSFASLGRKKLEARERDFVRQIATENQDGEPRILDDLLDAPSPGSLLGSLLHMHGNRLGLHDEAEERVAVLLRAIALSRAARTVVA